MNYPTSQSIPEVGAQQAPALLQQAGIDEASVNPILLSVKNLAMAGAALIKKGDPRGNGIRDGVIAILNAVGQGAPPPAAAPMAPPAAAPMPMAAPAPAPAAPMPPAPAPAMPQAQAAPRPPAAPMQKPPVPAVPAPPRPMGPVAQPTRQPFGQNPNAKPFNQPVKKQPVFI